MALQKQVNLAPAQAVPGMKASLCEHVYYPNTLLAETQVRVGGFVWLSGASEERALAAGTAGVQPAGFVEHNLVYPKYDLRLDGTLNVEIGMPLCVCQRGAYWCVASTIAAVGQKVFAKLADGSIATAAANTSMPGFVETTWSVRTAGKIDELIVISNV